MTAPTVDQLAAEVNRLAAQGAAVEADIPEAEAGVAEARAAYERAQAHVGDRARKLGPDPSTVYALDEAGISQRRPAPASEEHRAAYADSLAVLELAAHDLEAALVRMNDLHRERDELQRRLAYLDGQRAQAAAAAAEQAQAATEQGRIRKLLAGLRP